MADADSDRRGNSVGGEVDGGSEYRLNRRGALLAVGSAAVAAGVGGVALLTGGEDTEPAHEPAASEAWLRRSFERGARSELVTATVRLERGEYTGDSWFVAGGATLACIVRQVSGGTVDVWGLKRPNLPAYRDRERSPRVIRGVGLTDADGFERTVGEGQYVILLDNTDVFGSGADDAVELNVVMGVTR